MSEDEILEIIKEEITNTYAEGKAKALQGLLDLYTKEKEKNKLLVQGKFREVADKNSYIKDNYISKDKIKEELTELDNMKVDGELFITVLNLAKKILQELLEERN